MPPKALVTTPSTAATTLGGDTSIADMDSQLITRGQLQDNNRILKERINGIGVAKVKLPLIKRFVGEKLKLKGFLTQMYFKVMQEEVKLAILLDQVAYAGLFLIG